MTDARAALVERVAEMLLDAWHMGAWYIKPHMPHVKFQSRSRMAKDGWLKCAEEYVAAMERTREAAAEILKTQRFEMARGAQCIALIEVLENRLRSMPLPDATGEE